MTFYGQIHTSATINKKLSFNLTLSIANFVMTMREYYNTTYISVLIFRIGLLLLVTTTITTTPIKTPPVEWSSRKISEGFWLQGLLPWPNVYKKSFSFKKTRELWSFLIFTAVAINYVIKMRLLNGFVMWQDPDRVIFLSKRNAWKIGCFFLTSGRARFTKALLVFLYFG